MSGNHRRPAGRQFSFDNRQIRAAYSAAAHTNQDFTAARVGPLDFGQFKWIRFDGSRTLEHAGFHEVALFGGWRVHIAAQVRFLPSRFQKRPSRKPVSNAWTLHLSLPVPSNSKTADSSSPEHREAVSKVAVKP